MGQLGWMVGVSALLTLVALGLVLAVTCRRVRQSGLLALLPPCVASAVRLPLFEVVSIAAATVVLWVCNLARIAMLACMELDEGQIEEMIHGLTPELQRSLFQRPTLQLLPPRVQRLLVGRDALELQAPAIPGSLDKQLAQREGLPTNVGPSSETTLEPEPEEVIPAKRHVSNTSSLDSIRNARTSVGDLVRVVRDSQAGAVRCRTPISSLQKVVAEKATDTVVAAMRHSSVRQAANTASFARCRALEVGATALALAQDSKVQATAASAVGGAVVLGAGGGGAGLCVGATIGAACGLVPAIFTFGLSIPIGAMLGGGAGLCVGAAAGGVVGAAGGGFAGYTAYTRQETSS